MDNNANRQKNRAAGPEKERKNTEEKHRLSDFRYITREVLEALRDGDYKAFDVVYLRCFEPMQAFLRLLLHNPSEAEELCQELFAKLWENRAAINPDLNFKSYLYTVAKSSALKHLEHKNVVNKYVDFRLNQHAEVEHAPDEQLMTSELSLILAVSLENMPDQRRRVFEMSRIEGLTNNEIAQKLNISTTTVRAHLHLAVKELRELITLFLFLFISE